MKACVSYTTNVSCYVVKQTETQMAHFSHKGIQTAHSVNSHPRTVNKAIRLQDYQSC